TDAARNSRREISIEASVLLQNDARGWLGLDRQLDAADRVDRLEVTLVGGQIPLDALISEVQSGDGGDRLHRLFQFGVSQVLPGGDYTVQTVGSGTAGPVFFNG